MLQKQQVKAIPKLAFATPKVLRIVHHAILFLVTQVLQFTVEEESLNLFFRSLSRHANLAIHGKEEVFELVFPDFFHLVKPVLYRHD